MSKKLPYNVPEGYFEDLQTRLSRIPAAEGAGKPRSFAKTVRYLAIAASVAVGVLIGVNLKSMRDAAVSEEEALVEYLIESGTTLAQIANVIDY